MQVGLSITARKTLLSLDLKAEERLFSISRCRKRDLCLYLTVAACARHPVQTFT